MSTIEAKISGLEGLQEGLERAPVNVSRRILRTGLLRAAEIWREEMIARVRRGWHHFRKSEKGPEFGFLAAHIGVRATVKSDLEGSVSVGPMKAGFWAGFLEFGTRCMRAFPFIRQSFETRKNDVLERFAGEVRESLAKEGLHLE